MLLLVVFGIFALLLLVMLGNILGDIIKGAAILIGVSIAILIWISRGLVWVAKAATVTRATLSEKEERK